MQLSVVDIYKFPLRRVKLGSLLKFHLRLVLHAQCGGHYFSSASVEIFLLWIDIKLSKMLKCGHAQALDVPINTYISREFCLCGDIPEN